MQTLAIDEDNLIEVGTADSPIKLSSTGETVSDATITAQLKDEEFTSVGGTIDILPTLTAGVYQGLLSGAGLVRGSYYWLEITIAGTANGFRRIKAKAEYHLDIP